MIYIQVVNNNNKSHKYKIKDLILFSKIKLVIKRIIKKVLTLITIKNNNHKTTLIICKATIISNKDLISILLSLNKKSLLIILLNQNRILLI